MAVSVSIVQNIFMYGVALGGCLVASEALKRLKQSEVIGQVLVGIILGPSLIGILYPNEIFNFIAELGALTLLLIAGLETDVRIVLKSGIPAILLAFGGVFFTIILVFPIVYLFSSNIFLSLYVSVTLGATSISLTVRVFSEFGKLKGKEIQTIIISAVLDDLIVIFLLIFVIDLSLKGSFQFAKILNILVSVLIFFSIVFVLLFFSIKFLNQHIHRLKSRGGILVFVFTLGLLLGYFSSIMGFSPIIGAYFAGLILGDLDIKDELLEEVSPVAFLTVPIFLVNIGLKVHLYTIGTAIFIGLLLSTAAIIGKVLSGFPVGKFQKTDLRASILLGAARIPRAEVVLVFANIGLELNIIHDVWYSALVVVMITTTFLTPIILRYLLIGGEEK